MKEEKLNIVSIEKYDELIEEKNNELINKYNKLINKAEIMKSIHLIASIVGAFACCSHVHDAFTTDKASSIPLAILVFILYGFNLFCTTLWDKDIETYNKKIEEFESSSKGM